MLRTTETLGGAGNVAFNLVSLGRQVTVIGVCGQDATGQALRALLAKKGIIDRLVLDPERPTITKTRIMAHKQQMLRLDEESNRPISADVAQKIASAFSKALDKCRAVILSDYGKGIFAGEALIQKLIAGARQKGVPVLVDPKARIGDGIKALAALRPIPPNWRPLRRCRWKKTRPR